MPVSQLTLDVTPSIAMVKVGDGPRTIYRRVRVKGSLTHPSSTTVNPETFLRAYQYAVAIADRRSKCRMMNVTDDKSMFEDMLNRLATSIQTSTTRTNCYSEIVTRTCVWPASEQADAEDHEHLDDDGDTTEFSFVIVSRGTDTNLEDVRRRLVKPAPMNDSADLLKYEETVDDLNKLVLKDDSRAQAPGLMLGIAAKESDVDLSIKSNVSERHFV